jgi:hypothetical protein
MTREKTVQLGGFKTLDRVYMPLPASLRVPGHSYRRVGSGCITRHKPCHAFHLLNIDLGRVAHVLPREIHVTDPFSVTNSLRIRSPWEL